MARPTYGKVFKTRKGRVGRYVYVKGRRVGFESTSLKAAKRRQYRANKKKW